MTHRRVRRRVIVSVCLVAAVAAGAGTWALDTVPSGPGASAGSGSHGGTASTGATAAVTRGDLTDSKVFAGTLGYGAATGVPGAAAGTITWLPRAGDVIERDGALYAVDERDVRSMYGTVPLWRDLERGLQGADVRQLNENLAALGYDVSVDDRFGPRTERAVRQWQQDRGHEVTAVLTGDDVAFVDGAVRVASVDGRLGERIAGGAGAGAGGAGGGAGAAGDVLQVTSTRRVVAATVPQRDAERLAVGTDVEVRVNGAGAAMPGSVVDVQPTTSEDGGTAVDVSVSFDPGKRTLPAAASAQVDAKGTTERDVLSVPVAALVAGAGGRYAVDVVQRDGTTEQVRIEPGFSADGRIAVTGDLAAGDRVVVPG
ncbi:peptidoglycan-binding protein [Curtobacterium flaccumfaciens pv. flaccumfaciens]|uniref:peptidoglycan-binding protein n=1 Tax=Curtobacterium flaccumfaciens TaxID=2035 RepID=UPI00217E487D|nr:peptidoglycan-binding protein [Curtobacterium flaccumfaciens]MCS6568807.1 peptidoglycan-binding protein [Curtobacterium flaccumfaciens pv. flaccumfaciens]MCS6584655.1 peptidoglycan-binding protein [Curtobacterium flaccumfaciens pv. flaccumfaciens]